MPWPWSKNCTEPDGRAGPWRPGVVPTTAVRVVRFPITTVLAVVSARDVESVLTVRLAAPAEPAAGDAASGVNTAVSRSGDLEAVKVAWHVATALDGVITSPTQPLRGAPPSLKVTVPDGAPTVEPTTATRVTLWFVTGTAGDANFAGSSSPARVLKVIRAPVRVLGNITATMQWLFYYTPTYTKVLVLDISGASTSASASLSCQGRGCPFAKRTMKVAKVWRCGPKGKSLCSTGSLKLAAVFASRHLAVGSKITVMISRPNWIGRYYLFTIRARRGPSVKIACLAPGSTRPGVGCST